MPNIVAATRTGERWGSRTAHDTATVNTPDTTGITDQVLFEYDDWGPVSKVRQDHNSAVDASGSVDDYEVSYTYTKLAAGRRGIARSAMGLPDGRALGYQYVGAGDALDSAAGRVSAVWLGQGLNLVEIASYEYTGLAQVTRTDLPEPDLYRTLVDGDPVEYPGLDRFNRLLSDTWARSLQSGDKLLYDVAYTYGTATGEWTRLTAAQDLALQTVDTTPKGVFDWAWSYDGLFRLTEGQNWLCRQ